MRYLLPLSCFLYVLLTNGEPLVKSNKGLLKGITLKTRKGRTISAFLGIPYAEPPIENRRFENPTPAKEWEGFHEADRESNVCPQFNKGSLIGDEDCLYLNVFTPKLNFNASTIDKKDLLPVMVRIHGGGFVEGGNNFKYYGPQYFLDKDIVLVTMNYRLGVLGFFATNDSVVSGNFGLKDQVVALEWVKKYIKFFGGDPDRVTIFGESAGAACVSFHALSDASKGLFHQYIFESGNALSAWAFRPRKNLNPYVNDLVKKVNCPGDNSTLIVKCLRDKSVYTLLKAVPHDIFNFSKIIWIPTNEIESEGAFLTDSPKNLIKRKKIKDYPSLSGNVFDEGLLVTLSFYANPKDTNRMLLALEKFIRTTSYYYMESNNISEFSKIIRDFYFNASVVADRNEVLKSFTKFVSDCRFIYSQKLIIEEMTNVLKSPAYLYLFNYRGNEGRVSLEKGLKGDIGVTHGEEVLYQFPSVAENDVAKIDQRMIDLMVDLWTSFAINGKPASRLLDKPDLWEPYQKNRNFLQIGSPINNNNGSVSLRNDFFNDRMNFWKENFPNGTVF